MNKLFTLYLIFFYSHLIIAQDEWEIYTTSNSGICSDTVTSIYIDENNNYWFGTPRGVSKFDGINWTNYTSSNSPFKENNAVKDITQYNGTYYFGCETEIQIYDGSNWNYISGTTVNGLTSLELDNSGNLWIGTINGLVKGDNMGPIVFNTNNSPLPSNNVEDVEIDEDGNIWIAMINNSYPYTAGIGKYDSNSWQIYDIRNSILTNENIRSIAEDKDGNLWFGGDSLLLYKFDKVNWFRYDLSEQITSNWLSCLDFDLDGNVWAGLGFFSEERGLISFDGINIIRYDRDEGFPSEEQVNDLVIDSFNVIWAGTNDGLIKLDLDGDIQVPIKLTSFSATIIENRIELAWSTATETNNAGFEIQRSIDNKTFDKVGFVEGKGTTTESQIYSFIDNNIQGKSFYRLKQIDFDGTFEYSKIMEISARPLRFNLEQNYPNPFNPSTIIKYEIPKSGFVTLKIYDILGSEIKTLINEQKDIGKYEVKFDASEFASGFYIYQIKVNNFVSSKKMLVIK